MLVPATVRSVPASQVSCARHIDWFACAVYVPSAQAAHVRFVIASGVFVIRSPAGQFVQAVQLAAFSEVL
jgi:hypothetical protein